MTRDASKAMRTYIVPTGDERPDERFRAVTATDLLVQMWDTTRFKISKTLDDYRAHLWRVVLDGAGKRWLGKREADDEALVEGMKRIGMVREATSKEANARRRPGGEGHSRAKRISSR